MLGDPDSFSRRLRFKFVRVSPIFRGISSMGRWIRTLRLEDLSDERGTEAVAEGRLFALFRVEGQPYALDALCCHQGGPLGKASICGFTATCPWHGWQYDVRTGRHRVISTVVQPSFPTRVVDGWVEVELPDDPVAGHDSVDG